jgi:hypothetical protein
MTLLIRRCLYISFILIFLIGTPIISLYASGYKLGNGFKVEKTGILILNSKPTGAKIYIDGKVQKDFFKQFYSPENSYVLTPAKIKDVLPGEYKIRISLDGYWDWEKKLEVKPGQSTYAETVNLFKNNLPLLLSEGTYGYAKISPDKKNIFLESPEAFRVYNVSDNELKIDVVRTVTSSAATSSLGFFWMGNNKIFIEGAIYDINSKASTTPLDGVDAKKITDIRFDESSSENIFYRFDKTINKYDLNKSENTILLTDEYIKDFLPKNNYLFYIEQNNISTDLVVFNTNGLTEEKRISIPTSDYSFIHPESGYINLYDNSHHILYIIDPFSLTQPLKESINNVTHSEWISDQKLLYANDFEIWTLDLNTLQKTLLNRISDKIQDVIWHPSNNYVLYSTDSYISVIELDDRDRYNITKLIKLNPIEDLFLNEQGDSLFFLTKIGNQEGLYKLAIQ